MRNDFNTKLVRWFLKNPYLIALLFFTLLFGGIYAGMNLRSEGFPPVSLKLIIISTSYPGASATEVEQSVTKNIESAAIGKSGVSDVSSSSSSGISRVTITLNDNADINSSLTDIRSAVDSAQLPVNANKPDIFVPQVGGNEFIYAVAGNTSFDKLLQTGKILNDNFSNVAGVKSVNEFSTVKDQILINYDNTKLAAAGLTSQDLLTKIKASVSDSPAGNSVIDGENSAIVVSGTAKAIEGINNILITGKTASGLPGQTVKVSDVAQVIEQTNGNDSINQVGFVDNGKMTSMPGIIYSVTLTSDADILKTDTLLKDKLDSLYKDNVIDSNIHIFRVLDQGQSTRQQLNEVISGAIGEKWNIGALGYVGYIFGGVWLLIIALLIFINTRTALIGALSIPLSFAFSLIFLYLFGISLNTIVLFSLILVLGLIVDPAIVVLESLQRYKDIGFKGKEAGIMAIENIGYGVFIAVLTSLVVFVPFGVVSGYFGQIIKYIPITVIPALIASYFVPMIFLTYLGSILMKRKKNAVNNEEENLWGFSRWIMKTNRRILKRKFLQVLIIIFAITIPLFVTGFFFAKGLVKQVQFSSTNDNPGFEVSVTQDPSKPFTQLSTSANKVEAYLNIIPEVSSYFYLSQTPNSYRIYVTLNKDRSRNSTDIANEFKNNINKKVDGDVFVSQLELGPPTDEFPVTLNIYGNNFDDLKKAAQATADYAKSLPNVTKVDAGAGATNQLSVIINQDKAKQYGLDNSVLGVYLRSIFSKSLEDGSITNTSLGVDVPIYLEDMNNGTYQSVSDVQNIEIPTAKGIVRLSDVADISQTTISSTINRDNGSRYVTVNVGVKEGASILAVQNKVKSYWTTDRLTAYNLPSDAITPKGSGDTIVKSFSQLGEAILIALFLTYIILVLFFKSFLQPFIIVFAVPLSFIGIFPALYLFNNGQIGFLETLGILTLIGIVENVGIFVIDYANRKVIDGMDPKEAIILSTGVRFRPIFLTKVTALGSLLPLAILSPLWRGLSLVVIVGILISGILSLFTTPIFYLWFLHLSKFSARKIKDPLLKRFIDE